MFHLVTSAKSLPPCGVTFTGSRAEGTNTSGERGHIVPTRVIPKISFPTRKGLGSGRAEPAAQNSFQQKPNALHIFRVAQGTPTHPW